MTDMNIKLDDIFRQPEIYKACVQVLTQFEGPKDFIEEYARCGHNLPDDAKEHQEYLVAMTMRVIQLTEVVDKLSSQVTQLNEEIAELKANSEDNIPSILVASYIEHDDNN
jgi:hypothetical protein